LYLSCFSSLVVFEGKARAYPSEPSSSAQLLGMLKH
jgi:hypothetical protein